jgi:hypothetical protein
MGMVKKRKSNVIGLRPVPPDAVLEEYIKETIKKDEERLNGQLELLWDAVEESLEKGQPEVFAYAKLLNFLASDTLDRPDLVHLCASAMWKLYEIEKESAKGNDA